MQLTPDQAAAADAIYRWQRSGSRVFALRGLAGTGKTSLVSELLGGFPAAVVAPTGRAASVLQRKGIAASTIHAAIYRLVASPHGERWVLRSTYGDEPQPLVIVDEASMVNRETLDDLLACFRRVLLVGDHGQLPPIEGEAPLAKVEGVTLTTIMRQALDSGIIRAAHKLRQGAPIDEAIRVGGDEVRGRLPVEGEIDATWPLGLATCITAKNADRVWVNTRIREQVVGDQPGLVPGDRLVALSNSPDGWCNGTVADVIESHADAPLYDDEGDEHAFIPFRALCDDDAEREGSALVSQLDFATRRDDVCRSFYRSLRGIRRRLFQRGWCLTAHKAQGSEWPKVVVYGDGFGSSEERAAWRYTAATRAREALFWVR